MNGTLLALRFPIATIIKLSCRSCVMVSNPRGLPSLPAAGPLWHCRHSLKFQARKRAYYIAVIFITNKTCLAPNGGKCSSIIFV